MTPTPEQCVAKGVAYLDAHYPGWRKRVNLDTLVISSSCDCVLGQLHGTWRRGLIEAGFLPVPGDPGSAGLTSVEAVGWSAEHGFHADCMDLTPYWRNELSRPLSQLEKAT